MFPSRRFKGLLANFGAAPSRSEEAKSHLLALKPADAEAVTDFMVANQIHTFLQQGTQLPDVRYREPYRLVLDSVEQELDAPGQLGPLSLAKMKKFGAQLQLTLQSRGLPEVPPKVARRRYWGFWNKFGGNVGGCRLWAASTCATPSFGLPTSQCQQSQHTYIFNEDSCVHFSRHLPLACESQSCPTLEIPSEGPSLRTNSWGL